jgi:hypothetical protein
MGIGAFKKESERASEGGGTLALSGKKHDEVREFHRTELLSRLQ